jgi:hypothetical protein
MQVLDFYAAIYEELLAVPVIKGQKTGRRYFRSVSIRLTVPLENEKFPGADSTFYSQSPRRMMFEISFALWAGLCLTLTMTSLKIFQTYIAIITRSLNTT